MPETHAVAIVGVGITEFSRDSGDTPLGLAARAGRAAIADAGAPGGRVDGIVGYHRNDSCTPLELAEALGLSGLNGYVEMLDGGPGSVASVGVAASLVMTGQCEAVLCYRALNGRSGKRIGQYGAGSGSPMFDWLAETGYIGVPAWYAVWAQAYLEAYGLASDAFWPVVDALRHNAQANPNALMSAPLSYDDYVASRMIATPLRLFDCCLETDAACALVLARADLARDAPATAFLRAWGLSAPRGSAQPHDEWASATESVVGTLAPRVLEAARVQLPDVSYLQVYDNTSFSVCAQLEDLGVCARGEAPGYVAASGLGPDSPLAVNTNGGMLNEGHIHGLNGFVELVRQVRGDAGPRQVADCDVGGIVSWGFPRAAMAIVSREPA